MIVLEDDAELRSLVARGLREEGFEVTTAATAAELSGRIGDAEPDALVVDIGLPDADGRDVVQALRAQGVGAPVIFLTARDALPDRLAGFAAGGDDYLTKPFAFAELVARLRALVKRGGADLAVEVGGLRLDPATHAASCGGEAIELTPTEFRILARLGGAPGEPSAAASSSRPPGRTARSSTTTRSTCTSPGCGASSRRCRARPRSRPSTASATRCDDSFRGSASAHGCCSRRRRGRARARSRASPRSRSCSGSGSLRARRRSRRRRPRRSSRRSSIRNGKLVAPRRPTTAPVAEPRLGLQRHTLLEAPSVAGGRPGRAVAGRRP